MSNPIKKRKLSRVTAAGITAMAGTAFAPEGFAMVAPDAIQSTHAREAEAGRYFFARDGVLGTSFDLVVQAARSGEAARTEEAILAEISRLSAILSTYDPNSEISRFQLGTDSSSPELRELLAAYDFWAASTGGAINARLNQVSQRWREAIQTGVRPDATALVAALNAPAALNVDALGKGYIIDRAVAVARRFSTAGLLNIGGDLCVWGEVDWHVGVADPSNPAENAPPLTTFVLRNAAVATSGSYARYVTIAGQRYSHVLDPRTLQPVNEVISATVVAADCLTANALSTAACVLGGPAVVALADFGRALGHFVVASNGTIQRGGLFATVAEPIVSSAPTPSALVSSAPTPPKIAEATWPKDFQVTINVAIGAGTTSAPGTANAPGGRGARGPQTRAYVAVWVEDAQHKVIRTISVLGNKARYLSELSAWYQAVGRTDMSKITTRATRPNGLYTVVWDGLDSTGKPVPQGVYTIKVELNREHGRHPAPLSTTINCDGQPHSADLAATVESGASKIEYGLKPVPVVAPKPAPSTSPVPVVPTN